MTLKTHFDMKNATDSVNTIIFRESEFEEKKMAYFSAMRDGNIFDRLLSANAETNSIESTNLVSAVINFPIVEVSRRMLGHM